MANYFSGPSTPQMRLTMFLVGLAALVAGIFSSTHQIEANAADRFGVVYTKCGTAFSPRPSREFFPELAQACSQAVGPWPVIAGFLYVVAVVVLIRLLYMLIGSKAPSL